MPIDVHQFRRTVCEFRDLMGQVSFWANPQKMETAKKALVLTYLNAEYVDNAEMNQSAIVLESTLSEFIRRGMMLGIEV